MPAASFPESAQPRWASTSISPNALTALSLIVALGFSAICATILWQEHRSARDYAAQIGSNLVAAINSDVARTLEQYNLSLQGVVNRLKLPEIEKLSPETRQAILFDNSAAARYLGAIRVLDETGRVIEIGNLGHSARTNRTDFSQSDLFQVHKKNPNIGVYISSPFRRTSGEYVIGISQRISQPDGSFGGAVIGTLRLAYFYELFQKVAPSRLSALTLFTMDGTVIMRFPLGDQDIGRELKNAYVLKEFRKAPRGYYEKVALIDGVSRLYSYGQVGNLPLLMVVGIPSDEVYAGWRRDALIVGLLILALCGATLVSAVLLRRELARRMAAERQLSVLATTDSLTGLSNRRRFDEVIDREWHRAMREKKPVSLLLIDADWFKAYNDNCGHQTGDELLEYIAICIADRARRATDLAARYGGDEFTLLLPGTDGKCAVEIAEQIRTRVPQLRPQTTDNQAVKIATVSIGVAVMIPRLGSDPRELIDAADKALYAAKAKGRNRTELIEIPSLALAEISDQRVA